MAEQIIGAAASGNQSQEAPDGASGWSHIAAGIRAVLPQISEAEARERAWAFIWRELWRLDDDGNPLPAGEREFVMPRLEDLPDCDDAEAPQTAGALALPALHDSVFGTLQ